AWGSGWGWALGRSGAESGRDAARGEGGATVTLSFSVKVHGVDTPVAVRSVIRSAREITTDGKTQWRSGVEFADPPVEVVAALKNLIYQELIERPQSVM